MKKSISPMRKFSLGAVTCSAFLAPVALPLMLLPTMVAAQNYRDNNNGPHVTGFDVRQVRRLTSGNELNFVLYGTPGGVATAQIEGASGRFLLEEVEVGRYEGSYTVKSRDRLNATSRVTANLRVGNQIASALLDESLIVNAASQRQLAQADNALKIERFEVEPVRDLAPGTELNFTMVGSPGGRANVRINGIDSRVFLEEGNDGMYSGSYTIRNRDHLVANSAVTGTLRVGDRTSSVALSRPLLVAKGSGYGYVNGAPSYQGAAAVPVNVRRSCPQCGVVESTNIIEVKGDGSYLGTIAGGLAGGLLGTQVGGGRGKTAAEIVGAIGGAYAGREVEKNVRKTQRYEVHVRLEGGGTQVVSFETDPGFQSGERVKVVDGSLVRDQG